MPEIFTEKRKDYIELHERVARLETLSSETRDDVRDISKDVKALSAYLRDEAIPEVEARLMSLEGWRRWVHGISAAFVFIGSILAWLWEHARNMGSTR